MAWTIEKKRACGRRSYHKHRDRRLAVTKLHNTRLRREVLKQYASPLECACCGESTEEFLALDHIDGGGAEKRRVRGSGYRYYAWLRRNNYPAGYRVLCHNCNQATSFGRICPHKKYVEKIKGEGNGQDREWCCHVRSKMWHQESRREFLKSSPAFISLCGLVFRPDKTQKVQPTGCSDSGPVCKRCIVISQFQGVPQ